MVAAAKRRSGESRPGGGVDARRARGPKEAWSTRAAWWLAAACLVLPTLIVVPGAVDGFRLPQRMAAEWLALASLAALALAARGEPTPASSDGVRWRRPLALVLPLVLVATAGLLVTAHRAHVAEALVDLWIGAATLVGWACLFSRERLRRLLDVAAIGALPAAALGVLQAHDLWQPLRFAVDPGGERLAITSLAGNPGDLAALLVLPALVCQSHLGRGGARRWGWLAALLVHVYALAATRTLTSLLALLAGSAVLWLLSLPPRRALPGAAAALAALALVVAAVGPLRERVVAQVETLRGGDLDALLTGRLDGWRVAARLLAEHPLAGVGHGAYRAEFVPAKLAMAAEGERFFGGHRSPSFANAHNEYLEVAAETGWPGALALAWGSALLAAAARARWRAAGRPEGALAWAGLAALALLALAYFPFRLGAVAFAWLAFLAWTMGAHPPEEEA